MLDTAWRIAYTGTVKRSQPMPIEPLTKFQFVLIWGSILIGIAILTFGGNR